ncbi:MAG TPA: low molecular weight phosphatase family protein [Candidatus Dormibacteraeota bacterium]|nr:low molecular weight phosphatase family protein [Candidatus Dormibacteraeota bacterium]
MTTGRARRRVLFICVANACRSQLAEAFSRHLAADVIDPSSAGFYPLGRISEATRTVGEEMGLSFDGQSSKGFGPADLDRADLVVNLSGIPSAIVLETEKTVIDWDVEDPYGEELDVQRRIAAEIEARVVHLAAEFRSERARASTG